MKKSLLLLAAATFLLAACASEAPVVQKNDADKAKQQADEATRELNKELEK